MSKYSLRKETRSPILPQLKEVLLEFTLDCLLDQPELIEEYAADYFSKKKDKHTIMMRDEFVEGCQITGEEMGEEEEYELPEGYLDFRRETSRRQCIYSEPYNPEKDEEEDLEDVVYEKSVQQSNNLTEVVNKCILFRCLDENNLRRVVDAMFPRTVQENEIIIKQWDDGDNFYVIEKGVFEVWIANSKNEEPNLVHTYYGIGSFGELALMYNMPRAATIKAKTDGLLWALDRSTFRKIVLKGVFKKRKMYEEFIQNVPILQNLETYERLSLADALVPKKFPANTVIITQGEEPDGMYFIEEGEVSISIKHPLENKTIELTVLSHGNYFGELSLVTDRPRAATATAITDVKLAFLDKDAFERILGPCIEVMKRHAESYKEQIINLLGEKYYKEYME